ncbi:MAG: GNAT family N-acetyltransferase [Aureispira sp.]|nr:GNAT family N-acetyltransferase [Aureispira sp.]
MQTFVETKRFILREIEEEDAQGFFDLDANPAVHKYLRNNPVTSLEQSKVMIKHVRKQYQENGIGRWAIIDKITNDFVGWTGLKLENNTVLNIQNYYDLGYRLKQEYWGKGIATETAIASLKYGFEQMGLSEIYAVAHTQNIASNAILQKLGFQLLRTFEDYDAVQNWYRIEK